MLKDMMKINKLVLFQAGSAPNNISDGIAIDSLLDDMLGSICAPQVCSICIYNLFYFFF